MSKLSSLVIKIRKINERVKIFFGENNLCDLIVPVTWCFETYPILSIILCFIIVAYSIPIFIFLSFVVVSSIVTFTGFLVIEGACLGVALLILFSVLATLTIILGSVLFVCWIIYIVVAQINETFFCNGMPIHTHPGIIDERIFHCSHQGRDMQE